VKTPASPRSCARAEPRTSSSSSSLSSSRVISMDLDNSGAMTLKDGFSVVAATRTTRRFSTPGNSASCCALVNRWISSRNRTVCRSYMSRSRAAASMTARTSLTPAVTADSSTNRRPAVFATRWARVVFPVPGGPQMIADRGPAGPACPSINRRSGLPGRRTSPWPRTSSRDRGRIRTASGGMETALASGPARESRDETAKRSSSAPLLTTGTLPAVAPCATYDVPAFQSHAGC